MCAVIKSGATTDNLTIDPTSKAARVTLYDASGKALGQKKTYICSPNSWTIPATPTDMFTLTGSATKTVRVLKLFFTALQTTLGFNIFLLVKRSTADSAGTFVADTAVPLDSSDAAATASVGHWTANPTLGSLIGNIEVERVITKSTTAVDGSEAGLHYVMFESGIDVAPITLRGAAEGLHLNFAGAALPTGLVIYPTIMWTEE
jgi:hypothetical protein